MGDGSCHFPLVSPSAASRRLPSALSPPLSTASFCPPVSVPPSNSPPPPPNNTPQYSLPTPQAPHQPTLLSIPLLPTSVALSRPFPFFDTLTQAILTPPHLPACHFLTLLMTSPRSRLTPPPSPPPPQLSNLLPTFHPMHLPLPTPKLPSSVTD